MARKLAPVQYVHDVRPIEGADRIECIGVLGWQCVAKKGEFRVGDLCGYFEIDSFLPIDERFAFLKATCLKHSELLGDGYRLRTQWFRGQLSQGLALPLSVLPAGEWKIGDDVTELLGVRKWEVSQRVTSGSVWTQPKKSAGGRGSPWCPSRSAGKNCRIAASMSCWSARGSYENGRTKEGFVIRLQTPVYSQRIGANLSMKVVNNDYLIKKSKKG